MPIERASTRTCEPSGADALPGPPPEVPADRAELSPLQVGHRHGRRTVRGTLDRPLTTRICHPRREPGLRVGRDGEADPARVVRGCPASLDPDVLVPRDAVARVGHEYAVDAEPVVLGEQF